MQPEDYRSLINHLLPLYGDKGFEQILAELTANDPPSVKLLIKMEMNRLMTPVNKPVDLRGKVNGECRQYELGGMTYWLDDVALNLYHRRISEYGGKLTVGLVEELHNTPNSYRVLQKNGGSGKEGGDNAERSLIASEIRFGFRLARGETRIQHSSEIEVTLPDGSTAHGSTVDLSGSGARIKIPSAFEYNLGSTLIIRFTELDKEVSGDLSLDGLEYKIIGIDPPETGDMSYVLMRLLLLTDTDVISLLINRMWHLKQGKTDNEHKYSSCVTQSLENGFIDSTEILPVFFSDNTPSWCLLTEHNRALWHYWHDELNLSMMHHLFSKERLLSWLKTGSTNVLVYCFTHSHKGRTYFYSACHNELDMDERRLFWHLGANRESWRVLRITLSRIEEADLERLRDVAPGKYEEIDRICHLALIHDITNEDAKKDYLKVARPKLSANILNHFVHPRSTDGQIKAHASNLQPRRQEPRYKFKTRLELKHQEHPELAATTVDFSTLGLNIRLDEKCSLVRGDEVTITYSDLVKRDPKSPLKNIPYTVIRVGVDRQEVQLLMQSNTQTELRQQYLQRLIKYNEAKLEEDQEEVLEPSFIRAMHYLMLTRLSVTPYFMARHHNQISVPYCGINVPLSAINRLLEQATGSQDISMAPLYAGKLNARIGSLFRKIAPVSSVSHEYYVHALFKNDKLKKLRCVTPQDFETDLERVAFITHSRQSGKFFALRNRVQRIDDGTRYIENKLFGELLQFATHRAKQLESQFADLAAYAEFSDVTDELLLRMEL
ncbi:PilZ domain-containing protein [Parasalinivibrio latis]|uniref:PilZ domain-containing protein n=1 Tax=Parasalinivibrio latis TaxID=2952610 RepID=UPI0030E20B10